MAAALVTVALVIQEAMEATEVLVVIRVSVTPSLSFLGRVIYSFIYVFSIVKIV